MSEPVIIDAIRTPFARRGGAFRETRPDALLAHALRGLIQRTRCDPHQIDDVIVGAVTQAGEQGANIGRLAVLLAGFPVQVPAVSLNRMCGSSQQAIHFTAQAIAAGDMHYGIASGVESMTRVAMFSDVGGGYEKLDPELRARYELIHQGESAERIAEKWHLSREDVDSYAAERIGRASQAARAGRNREILPTPALNADGQHFTLNRDDGV